MAHGQGHGPMPGAAETLERVRKLEKFSMEEIAEIRRVLDFVRKSPVIRLLLWVDSWFGRKL